jgi:branched-chain amino acid transport system permease protein
LTAYFILFLSGLSHAATLFLVASGLSIIFGVTRIVNFAHGSLYMLGAYMAYSVTQYCSMRLGGGAAFWLGLLLAAAGVALLGGLMERCLLRRIYGAPEMHQLLATFGVVLVVQDVTLAVWGREDLLAARVPGLNGTVRIFGERFPEYHLFLIVLAPLVLLTLWILFHRTRWGVLVRAATEDRAMAGALGVDQGRLFTGVVMLGGGLAGLAGGLQLPVEAANLQMDLRVIAEAFVVVVLGGLGSVTGAFLAALLVAEISAFGVLIMPQGTLVLTFALMAVVLMMRPQGLLGRKPAVVRSSQSSDTAIHGGFRRIRWRILIAGLLLVLVSVPVYAGEYAQIILTEVLIFALLAASLHFIMNVGGLVSFGHAAYFGLGAYLSAWVVKFLLPSMLTAVVLAPLGAALVAGLFGYLCIRLSGVYLAMLTLAFAQILWSGAVQFSWTGGDNGMLGVWPSDWVGGKTSYYYVTLILCLVSLVALQRIIQSPFGYALRALRDSELRAEAIGIDSRRQRWLAFSLSGALAGLAGSLYVFHKGSAFPDLLSIPQSVDVLVMVLLGGAQSMAGPVSGAAAFHVLQTEVMRLTEYWRALLGGVILFLVLAFPHGVAGIFLSARRTGRTS